MELYFRTCYQATENVMRNGSTAFVCLALAHAALAVACSSEATLYTGEQPDTEQQPATPSGADTSDPSVLNASGDGIGSPASGASGEGPGSVLAAGGGEPEPNATETNFFTAGCRVDADCGATRRCEFPLPESVAQDGGLSDSGSDGGPSDTRPVAPPAALPDAGPPPDAGISAGGAPDAAPSEPLGPRGRCVDRAAQ